MQRRFFQGTTSGVQIAFGGFVIAFVGVAAGFAGFYINERWLALGGFGITLLGVLAGFIGVAYGWVCFAKSAVGGSASAVKEMRVKFLSRRK